MEWGEARRAGKGIQVLRAPRVLRPPHLRALPPLPGAAVGAEPAAATAAAPPPPDATAAAPAASDMGRNASAFTCRGKGSGRS